MNYGMERMKFAQPVLCGQHIRMVTKLEDVANLRGAIKTSIRFVIEIQETGKKALEGTATFVYYFKSEPVALSHAAMGIQSDQLPCRTVRWGNLRNSRPVALCDGDPAGFLDKKRIRGWFRNHSDS